MDNAQKKSTPKSCGQIWCIYLSFISTIGRHISLKSVDKARLAAGYLGKWSDGNNLVGCALYVEILKPPSLLSLTLQGLDLDIVYGIKQILKSIDSLKFLNEVDPFEWPTVKQVLQVIQEENGQHVYQGATLKNYNSSFLQNCKTEALADLTRLEENLRSRLEWSDLSLFCSLLVFVETQSWMKRSSREQDDVSMLELKKTLEHLKAFKCPLESQKISLLTLQDEIEDAVDYAHSYLSLESTKYRKV